MIFFSKFIRKLVRASNYLVFGISVILIAGSSAVIYWLEPDTFGSVFNGFWWVMTTVTTVGYGDYYPETVGGKGLAIFLYIFGIGLISIVISKIVDGVSLYTQLKEEGKLQYKGKQHYVIIDWSKQAEIAIHEILKSDQTAEIVLIDNLDKTPIEDVRVHYVRGNPAHAEVLEQANLVEAKSVFIFANDVTEYNNVIRDPSYIDGKTLLIATTIERLFPKVYTIVEIRDKHNLHNFDHIHIDEFILSSEMVSQLAVRSAIHPGASKIFSQLLTTQHGEDLYEIQAKPHWRTYRDAFDELLREGATLISDGAELNINRRLDDPIQKDARLFVICDKSTHARLQA